jgi:hypothetical protein
MVRLQSATVVWVGALAGAIPGSQQYSLMHLFTAANASNVSVFGTCVAEEAVRANGIAGRDRVTGASSSLPELELSSNSDPSLTKTADSSSDSTMRRALVRAGLTTLLEPRFGETAACLPSQSPAATTASLTLFNKIVQIST